MATERTAVLIVRAWAEDHPSTALRVSIRFTPIVGRSSWETRNLTDAGEVAEFVRSWLIGITVPDPPDGNGLSEDGDSDGASAA